MLKTGPTTADNHPDAPVDDTHPVVSRLSQHPKLRNVVRRFIDQFPAKEQALDEALAQRNWEELAQLAHWLKGAGGSVGFDDFFAPARDLETACKEQNPDMAERHLTVIRSLSRRMTLDAPEDAARAVAQEAAK